MDPLKENVISFNLLSSPSSANLMIIFLLGFLRMVILVTIILIFISDGLERDSQNFSVFVNDVPTIFNIDTIFVEIDKPLNHKILIND